MPEVFDGNGSSAVEEDMGVLRKHEEDRGGWEEISKRREALACNLGRMK